MPTASVQPRPRFRDVLGALYADTAGRLELRVIRLGAGVVARQFFEWADADAIAAFCSLHANCELFFGVALRGPADTGTLDNCTALTALFVDLDFKDTPENEARKRLAECPIAPSLVIASGAGLHAYWFLTEPITLPADASLASGVLRRLAASLGGDLASAEPARVLRVPGGRNHKYQPARLVTVEQLDASRRYNVGDFDWLPSEPVAASAGASEPASETIKAGTRNKTLYTIGRSLHARGAVAEAILAALREINSRQCQPPLGDSEIAGIVVQVCRQGNRADYTGPIGAETKAKVNGTRTLRLTPASGMAIRPVRWLWQGRIAAGTLALLGGREGIGKSLVAYTLAAGFTRGTLPGAYYGTPRAVIVAATEDSWEFTIVPRLMAAGADLALVYRVDVVTSEGTEGALTLPKDLTELERVTRDVGAVLTLLDPLLSRLDAALDTHKDAEVRQALEPLTACAAATDSTVLGLIHVNKSVSTDVLTTLMASRAFAAVARAVLIVMTDPENEANRLLGQAKNNLGEADLPTLTFAIVKVLVATTDEGEVWTAQLRWTGESDRSIQAAADQAAASTGDRTATAEATDWLTDYLKAAGGSAESATIKRDGRKAGHHAEAIRRARQHLRLICDGRGFPRQTWWTLPASRVNDPARSSRVSPGETTNTTNTTDTTERNANETTASQSCHNPEVIPSPAPVVSVVSAVGDSPEVDTTGPDDPAPDFFAPDGSLDLTEPTLADLADPIGLREEVACRRH